MIYIYIYICRARVLTWCSVFSLFSFFSAFSFAVFWSCTWLLHTMQGPLFEPQHPVKILKKAAKAQTLRPQRKHAKGTWHKPCRCSNIWCGLMWSDWMQPITYQCCVLFPFWSDCISKYLYACCICAHRSFEFVTNVIKHDIITYIMYAHGAAHQHLQIHQLPTVIIIVIGGVAHRRTWRTSGDKVDGGI